MQAQIHTQADIAAAAPVTTRKILRRPKVEEITGLSRSTIYMKMAAGDFPKPVRLGPRCVGWFADEVSGWLEERARERKAS